MELENLPVEYTVTADIEGHEVRFSVGDEDDLIFAIEMFRDDRVNEASAHFAMGWNRAATALSSKQKSTRQ